MLNVNKHGIKKIKKNVQIPDELQELTYAEQLLIAGVCHNRCIVKVSSKMYKMHANAILFSNPMPKVYNVLPPPIEEVDEVLAFIYTGPQKLIVNEHQFLSDV